ncbi:MAG: hypothetical protein CL935_02515 [Deltaproteobacteria bacterium]|nr:hypothetical protein [Deltaproteobacteria bacterium]|tara:strand:- start:601 stop:1044 length:444 start_codon:yes stop_codon:yes gene_type:complete
MDRKAVQTDTDKKLVGSELQDELNMLEDSDKIKHVNLFQNLLLGASIVLIFGTAIFALDLILSVVLGCLIVGFNFFWTRQFVHKLLKEGKLLLLDLLFYVSKFVVSVIIIFAVLTFLDVSPGGLLIGLSNIGLATIILSFIRMIPSK